MYGGQEMEKWMLKNNNINTSELMKGLNISEVTAKILVNRGIKNVEAGKIFIDPKLDYMNNPMLMKDMGKGISIIKESILNNSRIMVVGDYDVDGVLSTFILYSTLKECEAEVIYEIPHRILDGYGINKSIIDKAINAQINIIITCDNGISAIDAVEYAKKNGIKVIVTDHHELPTNYEELQAEAIINPKQQDCKYPFKDLCGAGVAFKFSQALYEAMDLGQASADKFIHIAAIATVCDVVDLTGENRIIVKNGLKEMRNTNNLGLKQLIKATGLEGKAITTYSLGFVLGPCINASGRLDSAKKGVKLLMSQSVEEADKLAKELVNLNKERKDMTERGLQEAINQIETSDMIKDCILVVYNQNIHESIAGIIAGRLKEKYYRPSILLTSAMHGIKGSGRSIQDYNMFKELTKCSDILCNFGGHPMAAGMSLEEANIDILRLRLNENSNLCTEDLIPRVSIDMQLPLDRISLELAEELEYLEPFGKGNSKPVFAAKSVSIHKAQILGSNQNVLRLTIGTSRGRFINGVYFGDIEDFKNAIINKFGKEEADKLFQGRNNEVCLDFAFNIDINEYMGNKNIQLIITNYR